MDKSRQVEDKSGFSSYPPLFRSTDRLRLEGYITSLIKEGLSLSLLSSHEAILDHYSKILIDRLRIEAPDVALEVYFPASSEALLTRFNEALSRYSIQEAMDVKAELAEPRIWIVHDASALPDHEIQLLARLVQHFPGANIRVILLMTVDSQKQKLLNSFGRRILCWDIEPPTLDQAENMLQQAIQDGRELSVRMLLNKITFPVAPVTDQIQKITPIKEFEVGINELKVPEKKNSSFINRWRLLLVVFLLLSTSVSVVAFFHISSQSPRLISLDWKSLIDGEKFIKKESTNSVNVANVAKPIEPLLAVSSPQSVLPSSALSSSLPVVPIDSVKNEPIEEILPSSPNVEIPKIVEPVKKILAFDTESKELEIGQEWVKKMPRGTFLVQHVALPSKAEALQWVQRHPSLKNAHIVAIFLANQKSPQYAIVSGPFPSLLDATTFVESGGISKDPMIRSARFMKEQFTQEQADADAKKRKENKR